MDINHQHIEQRHGFLRGMEVSLVTPEREDGESRDGFHGVVYAGGVILDAFVAVFRREDGPYCHALFQQYIQQWAVSHQP